MPIKVKGISILNIEEQCSQARKRHRARFKIRKGKCLRMHRFYSCLLCRIKFKTCYTPFAVLTCIDAAWIVQVSHIIDIDCQSVSEWSKMLRKFNIIHHD